MSALLESYNVERLKDIHPHLIQHRLTACGFTVKAEISCKLYRGIKNSKTKAY